MGERHEQKAGITEMRKGRPAGDSEPCAAAPSHAAEVLQSGTRDEGEKEKSGPDETMQHDIGGQKPRGNAMTDCDEPTRPEQRRADAARDPNDGVAAAAFGNWPLG